MINELFPLGYSISNDEVTRFKQNSIVSSNFEDVLPKYPGSVTQWVSDNVDHNICTLDGKNTFHGMGVIAVSTTFEQPQHTSQNSQIQRNKIMKIGIATANKVIPIKSSKNRQNEVYPLKSLNRLSSYISRTCFLFLLVVTCFGILPKRCILEINRGVAGLASFKTYPLEHTCPLLI